MEFKGKIKSMSRNIFSKEYEVTFSTDKNILVDIENLTEKELNIKVVQFRKKRSLDANAYCWVLIDKLSEKLNISKEELYRGYIKNIGGNNTVVCVPDKAVGELIKGWQHNGLGWQTDTLPSKIEGCTNVILYYGSSTYDTEQMSHLIDMVIQDCEAVDISTMTPRELAVLKQGWSNE